jgi:anti-sigma factor RsiW
MNWLLNRCGRCRESICLLTSGALPERETGRVTDHLVECADCREYCEEIKRVTVPLANWERGFAHLEPTEAVRLRWERAILTVATPVRDQRLVPVEILVRLWLELIWSARRIWAGFAFVWLMIAAVNLAVTDHAVTTEANGKKPAPATFMAWDQERQMLAEWIGQVETHEADRPKPLMPRPRSEWRRKGGEPPECVLSMT